MVDTNTNCSQHDYIETCDSIIDGPTHILVHCIHVNPFSIYWLSTLSTYTINGTCWLYATRLDSSNMYIMYLHMY